MCWEPDKWDIPFCKEMIAALEFDLNQELSLRMTEARAKMRGISTKEFILQRKKDLKNKIAELKKKIEDNDG